MPELRRLDRYFEISLLALVLVPFGMIVGGGGVAPFMAILFLAGVVGSVAFHHYDLARPEQARWWNTIIVGWVGFTAFDLFTSDTAILDAAIDVVLVLTLIRLFSRLSERDEMQIYALSFLMLAAATAVNEDLVFGLLFGLYVLIGTFSLAIFHLRSELHNRPRLALYGRLPFNRQYIGVLAGMSAMILAASIGIFFAFPRIGLGLFREQARNGVSMAGFSDTVELGGHGTIRDNPQVVMRVEFPDGRWPDLESVHWRTITFDTYDGRAWSQSRRGTEQYLPTVERGTSDLTGMFPSAETRGEIQIYLEPLGTSLLPTVWPAQQIRLGTEEILLSFGPRSGHVRADDYGDLHHTVKNDLGLAYILTVGEPTDRAATPPRLPPDIYTQTPPMTERVRELATEAAGPGTTHQERAEHLEQYLKTTYSYTLELADVGADPIDAFLFETKSGHCEYFATSLVMLLRLNGIPARLVNGFLGGRWNEVGGYLAVRQGDAHSWVEYWSPELGWAPLDPTPAGDGIQPPTLVDTAREYWDAMRLTWSKWIIEYDLTAQIEFFRRAARALEPIGLTGGGSRTTDTELKEPEKASGNWRLALVVGGLLTLAFFAYAIVRKRLLGRRSGIFTVVISGFYVSAGGLWLAVFQGFEISWFVLGGSAVSSAVLFAVFRSATGGEGLEGLFLRIERAAERVELARGVGEGPQAYLRRLAASQPHLRTELERFELWYMRARFSGDAPDLEELRRLRSLAARIASQLRRPQSPTSPPSSMV